MKFINKMNAPMVFLVIMSLVTLISLPITFLVFHKVQWSVSILGTAILIVILWYVVLGILHLITGGKSDKEDTVNGADFEDDDFDDEWD